jgi:ABC-type Na+ efflux pump permease subunit
MNAPRIEPPSLPGLGFLGTLFESARQCLLLLLRSRLLWAMLVLLPLLAGLEYAAGGAGRNRLDGRDLYCLFAWWLLSGVVVPWLTLYLAVQAIHGEIEDRTFQYLFLRPVGRLPLLLGKLLAVAGLGGVVAAFGSLCLFAGAAARPGLWSTGVEPELLTIFVEVNGFGVVAYAAAGALFAARFRRPMLWGSLAVVGQMLVALLPVSAGLRSVTVADPLRRLLLDRLEPNGQLARLLWPSERDFRGDMVGQPLLNLAAVALVALLLAAHAYTRREYDARERE